MPKKIITIENFALELRSRLESGKTIDCCKKELLRLSDILIEKIPNEKIEVDWLDN